ncbi:hypothetical protein VNO77_02036 [Canavalia gladiata]|uniref:Uncharacterized protein n=1 Tax=Canavalia gladiata TaxID=3824 RepID=A0AAN9R6V1_CANGL
MHELEIRSINDEYAFGRRQSEMETFLTGHEKLYLQDVKPLILWYPRNPLYCMHLPSTCNVKNERAEWPGMVADMSVLGLGKAVYHMASFVINNGAFMHGIGSDHINLKVAATVGLTMAKITGSNVVSVVEGELIRIFILVRSSLSGNHQAISGGWNVTGIAYIA